MEDERTWNQQSHSPGDGGIMISLSLVQQYVKTPIEPKRSRPSTVSTGCKRDQVCGKDVMGHDQCLKVRLDPVFFCFGPEPQPQPTMLLTRPLESRTGPYTTGSQPTLVDHYTGLNRFSLNRSYSDMSRLQSTILRWSTDIYYTKVT